MILLFIKRFSLIVNLFFLNLTFCDFGNLLKRNRNRLGRYKFENNCDIKFLKYYVYLRVINKDKNDGDLF